MITNVWSNSSLAFKMELVTMILVTGSIVPVGSSNTTMFGSLIRTCARATLCLSPPLNSSCHLDKMLMDFSFSNPTVSRICAALIFANSAGKFKLIASVKFPKMSL